MVQIIAAVPVAPGWYESWSALANVILAVIAVVLLLQGQRDRRKDRQANDREQANRISIAIIENNVRKNDFSYERKSRTIRLRNDSDLPINYSGSISLHRDEVWDRENSMLWPRSDADDGSVETGETSLRPHEEREFIDTNHGWDYAVFEFEDSNGRGWARATNTGGLYLLTGGAIWRQEAYQRLAMLPGLRYPLDIWPANLVVWSIKRTPKVPLKIPASARLIRCLRGDMPIGEPRPWELPQGFDARDWPYYRLWASVNDLP